MPKLHVAARLKTSVLRRLGFVVVGCTLLSGSASAAPLLERCYTAMPKAPDMHADRALYVMVDQTTPLTEAMKSKIMALVANWGRGGDVVKVARFSANIRGRYPELVFDEFVEPMADEAYLYNLRDMDKSALQNCLNKQKEDFARVFPEILGKALNDADVKIPKTDLLYSLRELAANIILLDDAVAKTVLIVSDGLENSGATSFYNRGTIRLLNPRKEITALRRHKLVANWKGAEIYMYGIGFSPNAKAYVQPKRLDALKGFWERYFVEGNGIVRALGTPELLVKAID